MKCKVQGPLFTSLGLSSLIFCHTQNLILLPCILQQWRCFFYHFQDWLLTLCSGTHHLNPCPKMIPFLSYTYNFLLFSLILLRIFVLMYLTLTYSLMSPLSQNCIFLEECLQVWFLLTHFTTIPPLNSIRPLSLPTEWIHCFLMLQLMEASWSLDSWLQLMLLTILFF